MPLGYGILSKGVPCTFLSCFKGKYIPNWTQSSKEYQGEIRKALSEQCKKIEENNRMGKTRDVFKKIGDTKEIFNAKMGTIKDRNGKDLTEAEEIKR